MEGGEEKAGDWECMAQIALLVSIYPSIYLPIHLSIYLSREHKELAYTIMEAEKSQGLQ